MKLPLKGGRVRGRLSYANVMSTLALFLALGGVSWAAATLPKNSVGTKQLRKYAVNNSDIRKRAVTGPKVKKDTLSSYHINESLLGTVPLAENVSNRIAPLSKRVAANGSGATVAAARAAAVEVPLMTIGQITLYGKCFVETGTNTLYGEVLMRTTDDGALALSTDDIYDGDPAFLNTTTPEDARRFNATNTLNNTAGATVDATISIAGPDGNGAHLVSAIWAKHGTIPQNSALVTATDQCEFSLSGEKYLIQ